jgi:hypothetical protein
LNVKQISSVLRAMMRHRYPAVVVHGAADIRAVLATATPVTLLSGPGAVLYAGSGWWRALVAQARAEHPTVPLDDILDCADASGLALGALRIGQRLLVLAPDAPGWQSVASVAASVGGAVLGARPEALDMAERGAARRLQAWLQLRTSQGDRDGSVS